MLPGFPPPGMMPPFPPPPGMVSFPPPGMTPPFPPPSMTPPVMPGSTPVPPSLSATPTPVPGQPIAPPPLSLPNPSLAQTNPDLKKKTVLKYSEPNFSPVSLIYIIFSPILIELSHSRTRSAPGTRNTMSLRTRLHLLQGQRLILPQKLRPQPLQTRRAGRSGLVLRTFCRLRKGVGGGSKGRRRLTSPSICSCFCDSWWHYSSLHSRIRNSRDGV